jgi:solute carrier family 10 (sodium/bile acid cotransporter), member 7
VVAGLGLKTEEFASASKEVYFNTIIQTFNFGLVSLLVFGFSRLLMDLGVLVDSLADGMLICACLPMAINMVFILTKTAGGDEAAAILNSAFANMVGVFLSPLLILGYLGVSGGVDLVEVFYKLAVRIVFPLIIGQIMHKTSTTAVQMMKTYAREVKKSQIYALVFIVYTVFCTTFIDGTSVDMSSIVLVFFLQILLLCALTGLAWFSLKVLFPNKPKLRVMGLFGCTHKTISVGVPLINAMYEGNGNVGLYTLPLLMWHPLQLVVGSILAPRLYRFVESEEKRLRSRPSSTSVVAVVNLTTTHDDDDKLAVPDERTPLVVIHGNCQAPTTEPTTTTYV